VIVCSCNVLTKAQILKAIASESAHSPRSPAQTYRCLGCSPDCGRCLVTVQKILTEARLSACSVGCATCPGQTDGLHEHEESEPYRLAAE
jgi:bacterioferritin-associated ferredoxin